MAYSYERQAALSGWIWDVKELSPKFHTALKRAIASEKNRKVKAALQEAAKHFEQVIDNLKVAEHEDEKSMREASSPVQDAMATLDSLKELSDNLSEIESTFDSHY